MLSFRNAIASRAASTASVFPAIRPRIAGEVASLAAIRSLGEGGMGCALLPDVALANTNGAVHRLNWRGNVQTVPVTMAWRHRRVQPPALKLFLDEARAAFAVVTPADVNSGELLSKSFVTLARDLCQAGCNSGHGLRRHQRLPRWRALKG